jgi:hypothetical protein
VGCCCVDRQDRKQGQASNQPDCWVMSHQQRRRKVMTPCRAAAGSKDTAHSSCARRQDSSPAGREEGGVGGWVPAATAAGSWEGVLGPGVPVPCSVQRAACSACHVQRSRSYPPAPGITIPVHTPTPTPTPTTTPYTCAPPPPPSTRLLSPPLPSPPLPSPPQACARWALAAPPASAWCAPRPLPACRASTCSDPQHPR